MGPHECEAPRGTPAAFGDNVLSHPFVQRRGDLIRRVLHAQDEVCAARVTIPAESSLWDRRCEAATWAGLAFPRRPIRFTGGPRPRVANLNHVVLFRERAEYTRTRVDRGGESTDVLWFSPRAKQQALGMAGLAAFPGSYRSPMLMGACDARLRSAQFHLFAYVDTAPSPDPGLIEQAGARILAYVLARAGDPQRGHVRHARTHDRHDAAVLAAVEHIACNLDRDLRLEHLARVAGYAPHHFARVFRGRTGSPVHDYVRRLRLQTALQRSHRYAGRTVDLALDLGFASRSHLSSAFARWFGAPLRATRVVDPGAARSALRRAIDRLSLEPR